MRFSAIRSILLLTVSTLGIISAASCSPDAPSPADQNDTHVSADPPRNDRGTGQQPVSPNRPGTGMDGSPVPPKDAQWTMLVYPVRGPTHVADGNALKETLIRTTNRHDWYVIHSGDESSIYLGYYRAFDDPHDPATKTAQADLQMVKTIELRDTEGQPMLPFKSTAGFVAIAAPDPAAPPAWNLLNKDRDKNPKDPTRAYWTLQIMAFKAIPERKEAAVRVVESLRKDGVEAYYFHGETISSVCVGAWPLSAAEEESRPMVGQDKTPVVYPQQLENALPKTYDAQHHEIPSVDDQGHELVPVAPKLNITDNSLKEYMKKFYYHSVNGIARIKEGSGENGAPVVYRDPSFLVVIPRAAGNGFYDSDDVTPADLASGQNPGGYNSHGILGTRLTGSGPVGADPTPVPAAAGAGHLRRLGE